MRPPDESRALDALAGRLDALGGRLRTEAARRPGDRAAVRLDLDALQSEAEGLGRPDLAEALGRLAPLTEIEECLAAEDPGAARELAAFGLDAIERLAAAARRGAGADP
ncbi:MAG TPA: hypothetical protein VKP69_26025, partial [Isosphaeraceae bacterium]|nr:hypothetical protein [Isosphaeraceae bacterium]